MQTKATNRNTAIEDIIANVGALRRTLVRCGSTNPKLTAFTPGQRELLLTIWHHDHQMNITEIAGTLHVSASAATQLVDSLVAQNFLQRSGDAHDRRISNIAISRAGKKQFKAMKKCHLELLQPFFNRLSDQELATFRQLTEKVLQPITQPTAEEAGQ